MQDLKSVVENTALVEGGSHLQTLLGQRTSGSQWAPEFICHSAGDLLKMWETAELISQQGGCSYYRLQGASFGTIGYTTSACLNGDDIVVVAEGSHGPELRLMGRGSEQATDEAHLIVGPEGGKDVIYTAYPGPITDRIPKEFWQEYSVGDVVPHEVLSEGWAIKFG